MCHLVSYLRRATILTHEKNKKLFDFFPVEKKNWFEKNKLRLREKSNQKKKKKKSELRKKNPVDEKKSNDLRNLTAGDNLVQPHQPRQPRRRGVDALRRRRQLQRRRRLGVEHNETRRR